MTALLPGATDSEFHHRAGMGDTQYGDDDWKNDRVLVARQRVEALFAGDDQVVGGDEPTRQQAADNRATPETVKAAQHAEGARPPGEPPGELSRG